MEQYGNQTTFNLESVLLQNIKRSQYWEKRAKDIADWSELVDEIFETVDNVEPWMSGNARGPSTAFNLLYRLCQLKPDVRQVRQMLDHVDSTFIRAIGLLYLRYVCDPRQLWDWFRNYVRDEEICKAGLLSLLFTQEFEPSPPGLGRTVTIGAFARDILLDQFYFETIFPRVPKPGGADRRGVNDGTARPASVKASLSVAFGQRAPNRAGAREQGRGMGADLQVGSGAHRSPSPYKREERPASRNECQRDRWRDEKERNGRKEERRERDYRRERSRSRDRTYRQDGQEREYQRRSRSRDYERRRDDRKYEKRRSRSRDRAAPVHTNPDKIREVYG
ncbi:hypothetical protein CHLNCDRAFT_54543 [Chlorella variabilis]|uniref:Pre-mRNA-splicing factor 38 n=1 Tax=Chlorella variabilis TaxID=554065 RepID=E1ZPB8_CHLVA|nr:hypothetical protein CHLNCDRAFT_54543 [Chlorella variabilis]EFN52225.1 hypothetical protein CHLNCDRAFT_54543 [Chlorella variabilis]|eukprot:XP_005844327.1 hypothetical protein CHLNCDRAFT_54543 [Chlorella variabilis]